MVGEQRKLYKTWKNTPITEINEKAENFEQCRASVDILAKDKRRSFYQYAITSCNDH